ncbi:glycosyltransferase [Shewanella chilikensis]|uniref:Glycosyltransferase n=3 Tax=Shewanellaceae TaxID=267890 RepID=A0A6G7LS09_9GAMM|nr:glycosyltransferase [Shewanella chilikensis]
MKYIFVVRHISPGGFEMATLILVKELVARGNEVEVWNLGEQNKTDLECWSSWVNVKKISKIKLLLFKRSVVKGEVMVLVNNAASRYAPVKGVVSIIHGDPLYKFKCNKSLVSKFKELVKVKFSLGRRKVVFISKKLGDEINGFIKYPVKHIPNPFEPAVIQAKANEPLTMSLPENFILHVGRIAPEKRQDLLLKTYIDNKELHHSTDLVFVGAEPKHDGPITRKLHRILDQCDISHRVHFLGELKNPWNIMKKAKCLVLCSEFESMGYVLLEAMALRIPIVATEAVGPLEVLGEDFAGLVKEGEDLGIRIEDALNHPERFIKELPSKYNKDEVVEKFECFIKSL